MEIETLLLQSANIWTKRIRSAYFSYVFWVKMWAQKSDTSIDWSLIKCNVCDRHTIWYVAFELMGSTEISN